METNTIPTLPFNLTSALTLVFYVLLISYLIFSAILYYHWQNYSINTRVTLQTYFAFFVVTLPLLVIMATLILL